VTFHRLLHDGTINPNLERSEIKNVIREQQIRADEARVANLRPRPGRFRSLIIDSSWPDGGPRMTYAAQTLEQIRALNPKQWADPDGCIIFSWVTNHYLPLGFDLLSYWGFRYLTTLTWVKKEPFGCGCLRNSTEHCLIGALGDMKLRSGAASIATH